MRFAMTAKTIMRERQNEDNDGLRDITAKNVAKVTRFREGGMDELESEVRRMEARERMIEKKRERDARKEEEKEAQGR